MFNTGTAFLIHVLEVFLLNEARHQGPRLVTVHLDLSETQTHTSMHTTCTANKTTRLTGIYPG